jgi:hypothetical protein
MSMKDLPSNVLLGLLGGLFFAFCLSAYVTILYAVRGSAPFEAKDTTYGSIVAVYFVSGTLIGLIIGVVMPLTRRWWGAMLVGTVGAFIVYVAFDIADRGGSLSTFPKACLTVESIAFAITVGCLSGLVLWHVFYRT